MPDPIDISMLIHPQILPAEMAAVIVGPPGAPGAEFDIGLLPPADVLTGAETVPVLQNGIAVQAAVDDLRGPGGGGGAQGDPGPAGAPGDKGDKGDKGDAGADGPPGPQGIQGDQGIQGIKGDTGADGIQGMAGPKGDKGDKGDTGAAGTDGTSVQLKGSVSTVGALPAGAADGDLYVVLADGNGYVSDGAGVWTSVGQIRGPAGADGTKGDAGLAGAKGDKGDKGDTGTAGADGLAGPKGDAGTPGAKGDKGDKGDAGEPGLKGDKGDAGAAADVVASLWGTNGTDGNLRVDTSLVMTKEAGGFIKLRVGIVDGGSL